VKIFISHHDVPDDFEGQCYAIKSKREIWYKRGNVFHRVEGPAIICDNGRQQWFLNGNCHRIGGPCIIDPNDQLNPEIYYIHGEPMSKQKYWNHPLVVEYKLKMIMDLQNEQS